MSCKYADIALVVSNGRPVLPEQLRIGHRDDALALLDEMIAQCEGINAGSLPGLRGMDKAIGSVGYFWSRLAALRDAIEQWIV